MSDTQKSNSERSGAMAALGVLKSPELPDVLKLALKDDVPAVRAAARTALARTTPAEALPALTQALAENFREGVNHEGEQKETASPEEERAKVGVANGGLR